MSTDLGQVGESAPTSVSTPATGTQIPSAWVNALQTANRIANPLSGVASAISGGFSSNWLGNAGLVVIGVVLAVGALLISQKETVIQVAATAAKAGA